MVTIWLDSMERKSARSLSLISDAVSYTHLNILEILPSCQETAYICHSGTPPQLPSPVCPLSAAIHPPAYPWTPTSLFSSVCCRGSVPQLLHPASHGSVMRDVYKRQQIMSLSLCNAIPENQKSRNFRSHSRLVELNMMWL